MACKASKRIRKYLKCVRVLRVAHVSPPSCTDRKLSEPKHLSSTDISRISVESDFHSGTEPLMVSHVSSHVPRDPDSKDPAFLMKGMTT